MTPHPNVLSNADMAARSLVFAYMHVVTSRQVSTQADCARYMFQCCELEMLD